jgi:hypothetical protein
LRPARLPWAAAGEAPARSVDALPGDHADRKERVSAATTWHTHRGSRPVRSNGMRALFLLVATGCLGSAAPDQRHPTFNLRETFMKSFKLVATTAWLRAASASASAQSLEIRKRQAEQEGELSTLVALTNKKCGIDLKATIETASFNPDEFLQKSVVSWCSAALTAIENVCSDAMGKQAVAGAVKSLTCSGASAVSVELSGGDLKYAFPFSSASNANEMIIRTYLEKHL